VAHYEISCTHQHKNQFFDQMQKNNGRTALELPKDSSQTMIVVLITALTAAAPILINSSGIVPIPEGDLAYKLGPGAEGIVFNL
jgi:hypothetical protein